MTVQELIDELMKIEDKTGILLIPQHYGNDYDVVEGLYLEENGDVTLY